MDQTDDTIEGSDEIEDRLIHSADLDGLIRVIDDLTDAGDFARLRRVRDRSRDAVATGRQLWPAATLAEYRIALLGPADEAARCLDDRAGRFAIGPLSEVIAQDHTWSELAPLLGHRPIACSIAHERAMRAEAIDPDSLRDVPAVLDIPAEIQAWEPQYRLAEYHRDRADFSAPAPAMSIHGTDAIETIETTMGAEVLDDEVEPTWRQHLEAWTAQSNGRAEAICSVGGPAEVLGALGLRRARLVRITASEALIWLAWAGASGGAHGRRPGGAMGRYGTWWVLAALADLTDDWPVDPNRLGDCADSLEWYWFDDGIAPTGWQINLVAHDRTEAVSWALHASDSL